MNSLLSSLQQKHDDILQKLTDPALDRSKRQLLQKELSHLIAKYLNAQIAAGVAAVQLFDSWAGCLSPDDYERLDRKSVV